MSFASNRRRAIAASFGAAAALSLVLTGSASAAFLTPESGGSPNADRIRDLYVVVLVLSVVVFVGVAGALIYSLIKFRARKGAVPAQIHGNTRLEIGWTVGAAVIVIVLSVVTFIALPGIRNPENSGPNGLELSAATSGVLSGGDNGPQPPNGRSLNIDVNGQQYLWSYSYPDGDDNLLNNARAYTELVVPTDTTVTLDIYAQDVAHSWWIPKLGGKFDAIPGYTNHTWFKIPGKLAGKTFTGQCAELCGRNHANMIATVKALKPADFKVWLAAQKKKIKQANDQAAISRKIVEAPADEPDADAKTPEAGTTAP